MNSTTTDEIFSREMIELLQETFETHHGIYLDKGTSLFETLDQISAETASIPVGKQCATLAAQVEHVIFYLDVLQLHIAGQDIGKPDWGEVWVRVSAVTPEEWREIKTRLRHTYQQIYAMLDSIVSWERENAIGGAMAVVVHTAYHLGEIRQALCALA